MQKTKTIELYVGAFVLLGFIALAFLAYKVSNLSESVSDESYVLTAKFTNIGGLKSRSPVSIAGVKVGEVAAVTYDSKSMKAVVTLKVSNQYMTIPTDSEAKILTSGLLGEQYIGLFAGKDKSFLKNNDEISRTKSVVILEEAVSKFFNADSTEIGSSYDLKARFTNVGGLKKKASVTMGGVKVGEVRDIYYDQEMYESVVILSISDEFKKIPEDTSASIFTAGLLGSQYVELNPGGMDDYLQPGGEITVTQSAIILEKVLGEFLFSQASGGE